MMNLPTTIFLNTFLQCTKIERKMNALINFQNTLNDGNQCAYFTIPMSSVFPYILSKLLAYNTVPPSKVYHITMNVIYRITV
jgi:hypothetical protein